MIVLKRFVIVLGMFRDRFESFAIGLGTFRDRVGGVS